MRYRDGCYTWELFYLFPSGMSNGILFSTQFIGMSLSAPKERLATSIGIYYLSQQLGFIIGPAASVAIVQRLFATRLSKGLEGLNEKQVGKNTAKRRGEANRLYLAYRSDHQ